LVRKQMFQLWSHIAYPLPASFELDQFHFFIFNFLRAKRRERLKYFESADLRNVNQPVMLTLPLNNKNLSPEVPDKSA
jgi:hypothetical protein